MQDLRNFFSEVSSLVTAELDWLIPASGPAPKSLREAMRWSLFGGGKHFRPSLVFAVGRIFGAPDEKLVRTAAAIEMLHTYSLIHDDLPSMDDDDLRRGRDTCHVKFGESTAILAGDALQALSFQAIAEEDRLSVENRLELMTGLARAAAKMVIGQQLDLEAEGKRLSLGEVENIHANKTGALVAFSAIAGGVIAGVPEPVRAEIVELGNTIGLLFQVTDDLLDVTQPTEQLGKTAGKDAANEKSTYPSVLGIEATRDVIGDLRGSASESADRLTKAQGVLHSIIDYLADRRS
ncbi:MAG: polyprenyl synthetase family protein [bacterium]|nr:polyprenyl synthetase family protein [bacterium]